MEFSTEFLNPLLVVRDPRIRAWLIASAQNLEKLILAGKISETTQIRSLTQIGIEISATWKKKAENIFVFRYRYHLNLSKLEQWCRENAWMLEDSLTFSIKGVDVCIPPGPNPWNRAGFSIRSSVENDMKEVWLRLMKKDAEFIVHREVTQQREWEVFFES